MSFSSEIKDELLKLRVKNDAEKLSMLCALTHTAGSITLGRGVGLAFVSEHYGVARLISQLSTSMYALEAAVTVTEYERLKARNSEVRLTGPGCRRLLRDVGCMGENGSLTGSGSIPESMLSTEEKRRCFIRGAFLGAGSVTDPRKGYHAEIVCRSVEFSNGLTALLNGLSLNARQSIRRSAYVVYIKEGEKVSDFLTLIGAMNGTMEFEHARIVRGLTNDLNRQSNFENANMQKTARAAAQQLIDIELLNMEYGLHRLPERLRATAEARLNMPEATLSELAQELGIGKSGLNHRLNKLCAIAEQLRLEKGGMV